VITCVLPRNSAWLGEAWRSLETQSLPRGWEWEWLVQVDGPEALHWPIPEDDRRISVERNGACRGPCVSRNMTLGRARGDILKVLDADDVLTSGQLAREVRVFTEFPDVGWVVSRSLDLLPGGLTVDHPVDLLEGPIPPGAVYDHWSAKLTLPVSPATLAIRRNPALTLGGWMGLPASEDTGLLLSLEAVSRGYFLDQPGMLYRKSPDQITKTLIYRHSQEIARRREVIDARVLELRKCAISWA